jgi:hypothetical protein
MADNETLVSKVSCMKTGKLVIVWGPWDPDTKNLSKNEIL